MSYAPLMSAPLVVTITDVVAVTYADTIMSSAVCFMYCNVLLFLLQR